MRLLQLWQVGSLALALGIISAVAAPAAIVYSEQFPNAGANAAVSTVGWNANVGATATSTSGTATNTLTSNAVGQTNVVGYAAKILFTETALFWTTEIGTLPQSSVTNISFYSNNSSTADALRIAIRLSDGSWYATDTGFIRNSATPGSSANWVANGELESFNFTSSGSAWRDLTFVAGSSMSLASTARVANLPALDITAVGIYSSLAANVNSANSDTIRFDTFTIDAVPEPSTVVGLAVGCLGMLGLRLRRRTS